MSYQSNTLPSAAGAFLAASDSEACFRVLLKRLQPGMAAAADNSISRRLRKYQQLSPTESAFADAIDNISRRPSSFVLQLQDRRRRRRLMLSSAKGDAVGGVSKV